MTTDIINFRFLTTDINLKALYIFRCFFTTSSVKLFVVNVQIFVYKFLFTIVFFGKKKNNTHETFHILKMKAYLKKEPHFGNEICLQLCYVFRKISKQKMCPYMLTQGFAYITLNRLQSLVMHMCVQQV